MKCDVNPNVLAKTRQRGAAYVIFAEATLFNNKRISRIDESFRSAATTNIGACGDRFIARLSAC